MPSKEVNHQGQVVFVEGLVGCGKSALVEAYRETIEGDKSEILCGMGKFDEDPQ